MSDNLDTLRKTAEEATPGPWHWAGNADNHQLYLATWIKGAGRCQVMDFERWGMQGAIPRFLDDESLMMQTAKNRLVFEVARNQGLPDGTPRSHPKVYRADVVDVMHPNAEFIATFDPPTVLELIAEIESLRTRFNGMRAGRDSERSRADKNANALERMAQRALGAEANVEAALEVSRARLTNIEQAERRASQAVADCKAAEQAVARVREVVGEDAPSFFTNEAMRAYDKAMSEITRALDGDGRG